MNPIATTCVREYRDEWKVVIVTDSELSDTLNSMAREGYDVAHVFRNDPCKAAERPIETTTMVFRLARVPYITECWTGTSV